MKQNFTEHRIVAVDERQPLADGEARIDIERFGFSANNVTYAAVGRRMGYWQFFPAVQCEHDEWGVIPVWGFGVVCESNVEDLPVGERVFGYLPPADELLVRPGHVTATTFVDSAPHRADLPAGYNLYRRVSAEPGYDPRHDNERMLLWPLLITSYCLWDALQEKNWFDAEQVIIVSASSKTGIGLAYAAHEDGKAPPVLGLTSARNRSFVETLPPYSNVSTYDEIESLASDVASVVVDMSGNAAVLERLYQHFGDNFKWCLNVGLTHWNEKRGSDIGAADRSEMFFAPGHIAARIKDWGMAEFNERSSTHVAGLGRLCSEWLVAAHTIRYSRLSRRNRRRRAPGGACATLDHVGAVTRRKRTWQASK